MSKEYMLERIMTLLLDADEQTLRMAFAFISGITAESNKEEPK